MQRRASDAPTPRAEALQSARGRAALRGVSAGTRAHAARALRRRRASGAFGSVAQALGEASGRLRTRRRSGGSAVGKIRSSLSLK